MKREINEYLLKVYRGELNNKCDSAISHLYDDINESIELLCVFISESNDSDKVISNDDTIWMFTSNTIIKNKCLDREREYSMIPINAISNVSLKFSEEKIIIEFNYAGEDYFLYAYTNFNKKMLIWIYNNVLNNGF